MARLFLDADKALIDELYPQLRRFAATVGSGDMDPDDLVQEGLLRTLRARPLHELENPRSYVCRAIVGIASNERRSAGRRWRAMQRSVEETSAPDAYPSDLGDLEILSPRARAILYLVEVEGFDFQSAARIVGVRAANARKIAARARHQLRAAVEGGVG